MTKVAINNNRFKFWMGDLCGSCWTLLFEELIVAVSVVLGIEKWLIKNYLKMKKVKIFSEDKSELVAQVN